MFLQVKFPHAAICIKAVYSQNAHCKAFLGQNFRKKSPKILTVFDFVPEKSG